MATAGYGTKRSPNPIYLARAMKMRLGAPRERIRYGLNLGLCVSNLSDESKHAKLEYLSMVSKHSENPLS
jgi:hypothetical protein